MPIEPIWLVSGAGAVLAAGIAFAIAFRRPRRRGAVDPLPPDAAPPAPAAPTVSAGEREAAWSAARTGELLDEARSELSTLRSEVAAARRDGASADAEADDLRASLATADGEITSLRSALDAADTRIAALETEIASSPPPPERSSELRAELEDLRAAVARHAAIERDLRERLRGADGPAADLPVGTADIDGSPESHPRGESPDLRRQLRDLSTRVEALQRELAQATADRDAMRSETARAREALAAARDDADRRVAAAAAEVARTTAKMEELVRAGRSPDRDAARLVARDAEIADLEARLAALAAARDAELRRLNEKLSSMERLYVEVEARDRRIDQLEDEVKSLAEARDEAVAELDRAERELVTLQGTHAEVLLNLERVGELERELVAARTRIAEFERPEGLRSEIERLQRTLAGERDRNARLQRRLSLEAETPARPASYAEWDRRTREEIDAAVASAVGPLEARIARLRQVVEEKESRIAALAGLGHTGGPDDLTRIRGVGPKIQQILHDLGVTTFGEIAAFTDEDVERVGAALPVYGRRILDDDWIGQARDLAR